MKTIRTIAEQIIADPANSNQGRVEHHRVAAAAEKVVGVKVSGPRPQPLYIFPDGSRLRVDHASGACKTWGGGSNFYG